MSAQLVDRYLHAPQIFERHAITIDAPADRVWAAVDQVGMGDIPVVKVLMGIRIALSRIIGGSRSEGSRSEGIAEPLFTLLCRSDTEVVYGVVARFWAVGHETRRTDIDTADKFLAFAEPDFAKATYSFRIETDQAGRIRLSTETRVRTTDEASFRAMQRYWLLIGPFSGLIRILLLREIRRQATTG
ncbi:DUF2867 domain-containing protein [Antrihabitans cavernicola]|nr:DUF2867 domain-containing protein [Spelaeibacter cavernicola]